MNKIRIDLTLEFSLPEEKLTVNGLVAGVKKVMNQIFFIIIKTLFSAIEEREIKRLKMEQPGQIVKNGHQERLLRTSFGPFRYPLTRIYDKKKRSSFIPLAKALSFPKCRQYLNEAMEPSAGLVVHVSFRRSVSESERIATGKVGKDTFHSWLQDFAQSQCQWPDLKKIPYRYLLVDGTGVRLQGYKGEDLGNKEMRWALASEGEKKPFEIVGFWIDKRWQEIRKDLNQRINYEKLEVLFSDGGAGIEEAFLDEGMSHQRCILHGKRDFPYLLYRDGVKKEEQIFLKEKLDQNPVFHFTKSKLESLTPEDLPKIKKLTETAQLQFQKIIETLDPQRYPYARQYLVNLSANITTFFTFWLEKREVIPLTTNALESRFSQVKNRIKRIGRRWSETGLLNWLMLTLNKLFQPEMWEELWNQYLQINPDFQLTRLEAKYQWI
jgi:hypothetical protein